MNKKSKKDSVDEWVIDDSDLFEKQREYHREMDQFLEDLFKDETEAEKNKDIKKS